MKWDLNIGKSNSFYMTIPNKTTAPYLKPLIVNSIISRQPPITEFRLSGLLKHSLQIL